LFGEEAAQIVPILIPGIQIVNETNIELDRSTLKADLVYNITMDGLPAILNMELQTDPEQHMPLRILQYHALLLAKEKIPVFSVILYPFQAHMPPEQEPLFEERCGDKTLLTLNYGVVKLWTRDAAAYVRSGYIYMYAFLPCMGNATADLLIQAIWEMHTYYPHEELRKHLVRFYSFLRKTPMLPDGEKSKVEEVLHMQYGHDWLIETLPEVIDIKAKGKAEGKIEGKIEGARQMVEKAVQARFPALLTLAQQRVEEVVDPAVLQKLVLDIMQAPDKETVRHLLLSDHVAE
jgi:hypothetical protein